MTPTDDKQWQHDRRVAITEGLGQEELLPAAGAELTWMDGVCTTAGGNQHQLTWATQAGPLDLELEGEAGS